MAKFNFLIRSRFGRWLALAAFLVVSLGIGFLLWRSSPSPTTAADQKVTIASDDKNMWSTFPGAVAQKGGSTLFTDTNRKIVNQDGSGGQANPSVNIGGPHLNFSGDFTLQLQMSKLNNGAASFRLYRNVPIIYDEWRHEGASLNIMLKSGQLTLERWDDASEDPVFAKDYSIKTTDNVRVEFKRTGSDLTISLDGSVVAKVPAGNLFDDSNLWFGADATGDGWMLNALSINGKARLVDPLTSQKTSDSNSLGSLAAAQRPALKIGAAISLYPLMTDQKYRDLALNQFTMWTPENEMKAQFIHPAKDTYVFQDADTMVSTALKNGILVHGHALVFGEANPTWMQTTAASDLKQVMTDHITTIMQHYKGKVTEWDVINEPLSDEDQDYANGGNGLRHHIWYNTMGEDYIQTALKAARATDPSAKLYINDYGLEADDDRWDALLALIHRLQAANIPLDGIGFQAHVYEDGDEIDTATLTSRMGTLKSLGLSARISEIDVHGEDSSFQAEQYQAVLKACFESGNCTAFGTWGISDTYGSTTSDHTYPPEYGNDLLWDSSFQPKPAVEALKHILKS
jgi:endo-1,4-beta-xylanase